MSRVHLFRNTVLHTPKCLIPYFSIILFSYRLDLHLCLAFCHIKILSSKFSFPRVLVIGSVCSASQAKYSSFLIHSYQPQLPKPCLQQLYTTSHISYTTVSVTCKIVRLDFAHLLNYSNTTIRKLDSSSVLRQKSGGRRTKSLLGLPIDVA